MNPEAEALLIVYTYIAIATVVLFAGVVCWVLVQLKRLLTNTNDFVKIMISLYEKEKEDNERQDGGGFGT